jgi:hypothetical protein
MRARLILLLTVLFPIGVCSADAKKKTEPAPSLGAVSIPGALGLRLGTVCRIEGTFFDGSTLRTKEDEGVMMLRVTRVNKAALKKPVTLRYRVFAGVTLPKKKHGERFDGFAYETGGCVGVPQEAWKHVPPATASAFRFESSLVLLKQL